MAQTISKSSRAKSTPGDLIALLGQPDRYGEFCGFECPRCGERRTHATPAIDTWRCWSCDCFDSLKSLLKLPRRPHDAPPGRAETPRRRVVSLDVIEVPA